LASIVRISHADENQEYQRTLLLAQRIGVYEKLIFTKILYFICQKSKNPYEGLLVWALKFVRGG
jgi:hypothetical protein